MSKTAHPRLILKGIQLLTTHLQSSSSRNALMERYELKHYRSFQKVNKNTFWVKASYINMEDSIEMIQKGFLRGHPKISKKSKNTLIGSKLRKICIVKVGHFWKFAQSQQCPKLYFLHMGISFQVWSLFLTCSMTNKLLHASFTYLFNLLWFYSFKIQIKSNKIKINHISCFWDDFGIEWR